MVNTTPPGDLTPLRAAADRSPVSERTLRNYIRDGRLTAYRMGPKKIFVSAADLAALFSVVETGPARGEH